MKGSLGELSLFANGGGNGGLMGSEWAGGILINSRQFTGNVYIFSR